MNVIKSEALETRWNAFINGLHYGGSSVRFAVIENGLQVVLQTFAQKLEILQKRNFSEHKLS